MNIRLISIVIGVLAACGLLSAGGGDASAVKAIPQDKTVFVILTPAETKSVAKLGIDEIYNIPRVAKYVHTRPDPRTGPRIIYVPGRGHVTYLSAERIVRRVARTPQGRVIIGLNLSLENPLILYPRW